jgi:hypothetical protein
MLKALSWHICAGLGALTGNIAQVETRFFVGPPGAPFKQSPLR